MAIELDGVNSKVLTDKIDPKSGTSLEVGSSGDTVTVPTGATLDIAGTISNSGTATGFGAIDWQTGAIKTANFSAAAGKGYFCNTTSGEFTATLPSSPSVGDQIAFADYAGTFDSNSLIIDPNGKKIETAAAAQNITNERQALTIVYVDTTQGWILIDEGDSTPITGAVITFTTTAGSIGTILDSQRASGYSLSAVTGTVTFGTLTYSISSGSLPGGLSMDSAGAITGTATAVATDTVSTFTVLATASGGVTASREFTIQVDDPIFTWTTAAGTLGTITDANRASYSLSAATVTVTTGTLSYAIQSGSIPAGLSFNTTTAAFSGTATAVSSDTVSSFTVRATTTSASDYEDRAFTIQVDDPIITYTTAAGSLGTIPDADRASPPTYGGNLSAATATASSGTVSYAIQSGSIPAGMSFSTSTAAFSGTADAVGADATSNFTVRATTTSASEYLDRAFSITIEKPPAKFVTATGGTVTTSGDYKIHTFTGDGTFSVSCAGDSAGSNTVDYVVVAGGGAGGARHGGGGGAGGYRESPGSASGYTASPLGAAPAVALAVPSPSYPITVGAAAAGVPGTPNVAPAGNPSSFSSITSAGGGRGGAYPGYTGGAGGSGGGGGGWGSPYPNTPAGAGNSPPVSPPQGQGGGPGAGEGCSGGGAGGATAAGGSTRSPGGGGHGGTGATSCISGSPVARAGGGGGASNWADKPVGTGGTGGGGDGMGGTGTAQSGDANTGGGGGGNRSPTGSNGYSGGGGSGTVIIRYKYQ